MSITTDFDALDRADMKRLCDGHEVALNNLMERHATPVFHFLCRMVGNEDDANDLAQETFVRVFKSCKSFRQNEKFSTWLFTIAAKVTKCGSDIEVDLTASDPQVQSFVNSSHANMHAAVAMALFYLIDPDTPKNSGALRPLKVVAKEGTIVWAEPGHPVTLCTSHPSNEIVEAIIKALAGSCPDRVMAGWGRRFRIAIKGENPRTGRGFIWHLFHARPGGGASAGGDGWSSIGEWHSVGGLKFGSIEVAEARFPLHFRNHEFLPDSGGDGQYRGGLGVALDLIVETEKVALGNTAGEGTRHGSAGLLGGEDSKPHRYRLLSEHRPPRELRTKEVGIEIHPGDCLEIRSAGGGGWGPPEKRAAEARERDRAAGLVTDGAAKTRTA